MFQNSVAYFPEEEENGNQLKKEKQYYTGIFIEERIQK